MTTPSEIYDAGRDEGRNLTLVLVTLLNALEPFHNFKPLAAWVRWTLFAVVLASYVFSVWRGRKVVHR